MSLPSAADSAAGLALLLLAVPAFAQTDPLPFWNDDLDKARIIESVVPVTEDWLVVTMKNDWKTSSPHH